MRILLGITGAFLGLLIVALLSMSWVVVYVHDRDEGLRLVIPAPVFLAEIGLRLGGIHKNAIDLPPEAREALPLLRPLIEELRKAPDFEMVRVQEPGLDISVRKAGDTLDISVDDHGEQVRVKAPLSLVETAARAMEDGHLRIGELSGIFHGVSRMKLVDVHQDNQDVRIWIW